MLINKYPHEFGNRKRRMGFILNIDFIRKIVELLWVLRYLRTMSEASTQQKILLHQPQLFSGIHSVTGIKNFRDGFGFDFLFDGPENSRRR